MRLKKHIDLNKNSDIVSLMNTKLLAIGAAVILLLGAGGLYLYTQSGKTQAPSDNSTTTTNNENKAKSLMDLISSGQSQRCTFASTNENGSTKGTVYVSSNNARTDITTTVDGKESEISMIRKGNDNYIWGSDLEQGIKMTLSLEELSTNEQANQYTGSVNPNEKVDFSCMPWTVDESLFTPPVNIKFTDVSAMMEKTKGTPGTMPNTSACDAIADPTAKASCIKALSGN